uniref:Tryptophan synthase alpha chain n=1 Tax=Compsopogon caeruleus TaxID=31354 RepID=A0A1Z1XBA9_9RHOD|nr:tryptophan synthase subunit alpha [Compsopogon caeruleus]ARX96151.1 tryptophan synthase subunit alpha [Compsopogon caeruleus]
MSMINISNKFNTLKGKCAFIPFITAGYPSLKITKAALSILDKEQADIIEIGLPYTDSLADGPIIQKAAEIALNQGTSLKDIFIMLEEIIPNISTPIIIFSYYNIILNYKPIKFIKKIKNIGVQGLLIPDLPIEESLEIINLCKQENIALILLISPTSSNDRIKKIVQHGEGFLYIVSSTGVTGIRENFNTNIKNLIKKVKDITDIPVVVGFGISNTKQLLEIKSSGTEGVVVGSALMKLLNNVNNEKDLREFQEFCREMKSATL